MKTNKLDFKEWFEANFLDGDDVSDCGGAMLSAKNVYEEIAPYIEVEVAKARIEELKLAGQHIQFKDPDYAILRIKALTAEVESNGGAE